MLLDAIASDLPRGGLIEARGVAFPWRRLGEPELGAVTAHRRLANAAMRDTPANATDLPDLASTIVVTVGDGPVPIGLLLLDPHPLELEVALSLSVAPRVQRGGIGTGMAQLGVALAAGAGCRRSVILCTRGEFALRRLAAHLGFLPAPGAGQLRLVRDLDALAQATVRDAA